MLEAVIFDVDGTLVDSEQEGHRVAFNQVFAELGLDDRWDRDTYRELLSTTGGEERILAWLSRPEARGQGRDDDERRRLAGAIHRAKTQRFMTLAADGAVPARAGARRLVAEIASAGIGLAVATTGSRAWVAPLLDKLFGPHRFAVTVTGEDVRHRKPDPEAYLVALDRLGIPATHAVAIEDSGPGWAAARGAGLVGVIVANPETDLAAVLGADLVINGFGADGGDVPAPAIADRFGVMGAELTCETLVALLAARQAADRGPGVAPAFGP